MSEAMLGIWAWRLTPASKAIKKQKSVWFSFNIVLGKTLSGYRNFLSVTEAVIVGEHEDIDSWLSDLTSIVLTALPKAFVTVRPCRSRTRHMTIVAVETTWTKSCAGTGAKRTEVLREIGHGKRSLRL
jgi:hypothetical protein